MGAGIPAPSLEKMIPAPLKEEIIARLCQNGEVDLVSGRWNWTGTMTGGRGRVTFRQLNHLVHRLSRAAFYNFCLASPLRVCHSCDNRRRFNPRHTFIGFPLDDGRDMVRKNRQAKGEDNGNASLTEKEVLKMRDYLRAGFGGRKIGRIFGVNKTTVLRIKNGETWRHLSSTS